MRLSIAFFLFVTIPLNSSGQLMPNQVKTLNAYVDYANQSADEVTAVVKSVMDYYPSLFEKRSWNVPRYNCPVQPEEYYYTTALQQKAEGASFQLVKQKFLDLKAAADDIDRKCKELDTYHKLEDYKRDNYAAGKRMVEELQPLVGNYQKSQRALSSEIDVICKKLVTGNASYVQASQQMRQQLERERSFLDRWKLNLNENVPGSWITEDLKVSISETDQAVKKLSSMKPALSYPASSMWPSFTEALSSILETKRHGLDEYNFDAQKSDKHPNDVYLSLINYYNGALLADYNTFIGFAAGDKFAGVKAIKYVPSFFMRAEAEKRKFSVTPFRDQKHEPVSVLPQKAPVTKPVFSALTNYVDLINETYRQIAHHRDVIRNLNSSAAYWASQVSHAGKGGISFSHDSFVMPRSYHQKALSESTVLPPSFAGGLNKEADVLMEILREIDELGAVMELEVKEKRYQQDNAANLYSMIERTVELFNTWDTRKEVFFEEIVHVFDSYPAANVSSSWYTSGKALRELTGFDHEGLFSAKAFYNGKHTGPVATQSIDGKLREVLSSEYDNMKGIEKLGRNNGRCPYTPYEDLPKNSRTLSELFQELKPAKPNEYAYQHPYHSMVYLYNEVVDDYNTFCELSPVPLLKYIKQPELFKVIYPEKKDSTLPPGQPTLTSDVGSTSAGAPQTSRRQSDPDQRAGGDTQASREVIRDTVYIEKRDTVYIREEAGALRSMEGYATNNMVLLLDVSGSMNAPEKLPLLKKSVLDMLSMMRREDEISIVVFSGKPKTLLPSVSFKDEEKIREAINDLKPSGTTDGNAGIKLAYKVADDNYIRGGNNRIVLATDGEFPISKETEELISKFAGEDIFLTVFNFGKKSGSSKNLERIAAMGHGNYEFISKENVEVKLIREAKAKKSK
jgi:Ca-activated chloride channel homolog